MRKVDGWQSLAEKPADHIINQAAVLFSIAAKIVRLSPTLRPIVQIRDTAKELLCPELGTAYKALSAEASTALGRNPSFTVFDETGQVQGPRSEFYEAMEMATAAQEAPLTVIISTQASSPVLADSDVVRALGKLNLLDELATWRRDWRAARRTGRPGACARWRVPSRHAVRTAGPARLPLPQRERSL
jgi:hypothetical protein